MRKHPITSRSACAALVLLGALALPAMANAKTCKSWGFIGQGTAVARSVARLKARNDWKAKVTAYWGVQWNNWSAASSKWQHCEREGNRWRCRASAVPCNRISGFKAK